MTYLQYLSDEQFLGPLRLFRYITVRSVGAAATALLLSFVLGPWIINKLRQFKAAQAFRNAAEVGKLAELHAKKGGTPTMGGLIIFISVFTSTMLWARPNVYIVTAMLVYTGLTIVGFLDDYLKIKYRNSKGLSGRYKLMGQGILTIAAIVLLLHFGDFFSGGEMRGEYVAECARQLWLPFLKNPLLAVMPVAFMAVFLFFVLAGSSNAINLTDGMDGLAIGCTVTAAMTFGIMSYATGHAIVADYLLLKPLPGTGELTILCAALVAGSLGFLWYNAHPAQVFMGDTGSLAIGGLIGIVAFMIQQPFTLVIVGGIFVMEAGSVIIQVASFKSTGRRVFLCSPIHHHFELKGWAETQVVVRFWILSLIFAVCGLATLKLR
ncbi:MAG: phospho-N-acetylmuramoyl-pentapeptide-transferase [Opitutales bacterium]|nr:phospho-N-acetylmuramoyl-pentapeptide-transferase [Opitutales bacterium]